MSDLPDYASLPPLRDLIAAHELRAEKSLGQNFLLDQNITDKIAALAGDLSNQTVFEVGPGPGGLTRSLLKAGAKAVIAVEFDYRAVKALQELVAFSEERLCVIEGDAMKQDFTALCPDSARVIAANLPYNIATPLLIGWLRQLRADYTAYSRFVLMFQKEVADRIAAPKGTKAYGRLSVMAQWLCDVRVSYDLPPQAFTPPPKVKSSVVVFRPKVLEVETDDALPQPSFEAMEAITAAAFNQRRKMIRSSLKAYSHVIEQSGIDPELRAEQLTVEDYVRLASLLDS